MMEQLGIILRLELSMKNLSVENFKMVFGVEMNESILVESEGSKVIYFYHWQDGAI